MKNSTGGGSCYADYFSFDMKLVEIIKYLCVVCIFSTGLCSTIEKIHLGILQGANVAASSIALSINGDEGGGKSRAEPREFIKKSNRASGKIPVKKFGPKKKRKRTGCFVTSDAIAVKSTTHEKSRPRVVNGRAPRSENCRREGDGAD